MPYWSYSTVPERVLVCGSRTWRNSIRVHSRLKALPRRTIVMHGGAGGADTIADEAALRYGHQVEVYPANWEEHGKKAGILRNLVMLDQQPWLVIAFWDGKSRGTKHTIDEALKHGIPVEIHR